MNPILLTSIAIAIIGTFIMNVIFTIFLRFILDVSLNGFLITLLSIVISVLFGLRFYKNNMPKITMEKPKESESNKNR
ncbi:MAG: hypothetical protein VX590_01735 [Chloroflexota bacterium]|nr:hypothetical protein [Chloroflexota bacterium]|tara:strand:- start:552 stop:785 length:234 start_codon:yes stop_codon:yes gene_type:complete